MPNAQTQQSRRLLRLPEVKQRVGLSRTEIYRRIQRGAFPRSIPLGPQSAAWDSIAIDTWIDGQLRAAEVAR